MHTLRECVCLNHFRLDGDASCAVLREEAHKNVHTWNGTWTKCAIYIMKKTNSPTLKEKKPHIIFNVWHQIQS